jgi:hypothetical protein
MQTKINNVRYSSNRPDVYQNLLAINALSNSITTNRKMSSKSKLNKTEIQTRSGTLREKNELFILQENFWRILFEINSN